MDAGRLLKSINDIMSDEEVLALQSHFQKISTAYNEVQPNSNIVDSERESIKQALVDSSLINYVRSDYEILEALGATEYFGEESFSKLNEILRGEPHTIKTELADFVRERQELLGNFVKMKASFDAFDIKPRELDNGNYQFGFTLPDSYRDFISLETVLKDIHQLLSAVAHAVKEPADFKISYVSSSELQFYINVVQSFAANMTVLLDCALRLYGSYGMYNDLQEKFGIFSSTARKKQAVQITEEDKAERAKDFAEQLIKELGIETPDDQNRVRILFARFLRHMEKGVGAEIRTPSITVPEDPAEDATPQERNTVKQLKQDYQRKVEIDTKNKAIYMLQKNNFDGVKLDFLEAVSKEKITEIKVKKASVKRRRKHT